MPIKNIPVSGPIDAEDRLIVSCNTEPSFSTTNTKPKEKSLLLITIGYSMNYTVWSWFCLVEHAVADVYYSINKGFHSTACLFSN